ncbi:NmrA family NAD(P)-binding protein [Listeria welshimeri]|nr:NmrA family NAD(P)-binding protein [Listeria welshimeri]MBC1346278.1 NmrA family NAD(P)-binding protein [Listeria welshimeri]MBC1498928.1 NmrA family NAD(P)-binding protein [Listeria welshimeri]MBC1517929.1 NmrA family NAD(P)-binding protein [Listeria welshimeri]MBC2015727.1 NmrA family NAD(P)-binding protein [Listeria welshimeri]
METILIIGGTGNIGYPLIEALTKKENVNLVVGAHNVENTKKKLAHFDQLEVKAFDFLDASTYETCLKGIDRLFFVRPPELSNPKEDMFPFLEKVKLLQIKQVVFVSLIGVEKNPMTPHNKIEKKIEALNLPYTFIRPSFFMQNLNTTHLEDIRKHHDLFVPAGKALTSFIDTRDIGAVAAVCLSEEKYIGRKIEITGAKAISYYQAAEIMSEVLGVPISYSKPSLWKFRKVMLRRGIPKNFVNVMVMLYFITQLGNAKKVTHVVEEILNREPISFAKYVADNKEQFL